MGLAERIVHSSWVKEVWAPLNDDFQKFHHYPKYPSAKAFADSKPDLYYATYSSAFEDPSDNSYGDNKTYSRDEIHAAGINTYLASSYGEKAEYRPEDVSVDALYQEVWHIAIIFDAIDAARNLVDGIESHFEQALMISQQGADSTAIDQGSEPIRVFWLDTFKSKSNPDPRPFVGACCGKPQIVLDKAVAVNVFGDQGKED